MPAILLFLIPILGEEATVALFVSLCRFSMAAMPFFAALTENVGPAAPVERAAARVVVQGMESYTASGVRGASSLISQAYEHAFRYWRPHVGAYRLTTGQLREALAVVKQCGRNEARVTELVRRAARHERPAAFHPPAPNTANLLRAAEFPVLSNPGVSSFLARNFIVLRHTPTGCKAFWRANATHEHPLGSLVMPRDPRELVHRITELMRASHVVVHP